MGITESAVVALVIFLFHMLSMVMQRALLGQSHYGHADCELSCRDVHVSRRLCGFCRRKTPAGFPYNFSSSTHCTCYNQTSFDTSVISEYAVDEVSMFTYNWVHTAPAMGIAGAIYFGFSSALLGISGFESSSNYVENQKDGVFPKTLRNMWIAVTFINPSIAFLAQCLARQRYCGTSRGRGFAVNNGREGGWPMAEVLDCHRCYAGSGGCCYHGFRWLYRSQPSYDCGPLFTSGVFEHKFYEKNASLDHYRLLDFDNTFGIANSRKCRDSCGGVHGRISFRYV